MPLAFRVSLLAAVGLLFAVSAPAAHAGTRSETASSGPVSATIEWRTTHNKGTTGVEVRISRGGTQLVSEAVQPDCEIFCWEPPGDEPLRIRDLNHDGEPEVIVDLYTGGAHCCSVLLVYGFDAISGRYLSLTHDFGNPSYRLTDLGADGIAEFVTEDDRFSYLYTSYLESWRPLKILRYDPGGFVDVTRSFPSRVRSHARWVYRWYLRLRRDRDIDVRGVIAAWQADNYLLGEDIAARGWRKLGALARHGKLRRSPYSEGPSGFAYLRTLRRDLVRFGYVPFATSTAYGPSRSSSR